MARKWPPIRDAKKAARRPYRGPNPRQKWETQCCHCQQWFMDKQTQVDHIIPAGPCRSFEQAVEFMRRLLVELPLLRVLCHQCHQERHANEERGYGENALDLGGGSGQKISEVANDNHADRGRTKNAGEDDDRQTNAKNQLRRRG